MGNDSLIAKLMNRLYPKATTPEDDQTALKFFNTLSRKKEVFKPLKKGVVSMYNCGPTVYNFIHIGNLRAFTFADTLRRVLKWNGYNVNQVMNITDVGHLTSDADDGEDKMEIGARREGKTAKEIAERYTASFFEDIRALNIETENVTFPKASEHIPEQIAVIKTLEEKGYTYKTTDGIYFDTSRYPDYGKLGQIKTESLKEGARVEKNPEKKNGTDFALWKLSPPEDRRQQEWESPWGVGFPGWHIECSAMSMKYLGKTFDIHTGGVDHIPVHHNNEIAQSECATGKPLAKYWLHAEHLRIEGRKISKSIGNTIYLKNIVDRGISPIVFRHWLLTSHYRSPVNFTWEALEGSGVAPFKIKRLLVEGLKNVKPNQKAVQSSPLVKTFRDAINNDLDTPKALSILFEIVKDGALSPADKRALLLHFDQALGLGLKDLDEEFWSLRRRVVPSESLPSDVKKLLELRGSAREGKRWAEADLLRDEIKKLGFEISDSTQGVEVYKV